MNNNSDNNTDMDVSSLPSMLKIMDDHCNNADYSRPKIISISSFLAIFVAGFWCQIVALPATWRLAKKRAALLIMFHADLGHCLMLTIYITMCLEYFSLGHHPAFPLGLDGFYYSLIATLIGFCYVLLALNRFVAVFLPFRYDQIFSERFHFGRTILWVGACWLVALLYSALSNSKPELRPYPCVNEFVVGYLITNQRELNEKSTYVIVIWNFRKLLGTFFALMPMALYLAAIYRMVSEHYQNGPLAAATSELHRERARLFQISLLSTLPCFVQYLLSYVQILFGNSLPASWHTFLYKFVFTLFQLHQPFLLYWLSADFRRELRRDIGRMAALIGKPGEKPQQNLPQINNNHTKTAVAVIVPTRVQVWN